MTVAAEGHAAPAAVVGAGAVVEPEDAVLIFAVLDEAEVARGEELGCGFGDGRENLLRSVLLPTALQCEPAVFFRDEFEITAGLGEECVERLGGDAPACLLLFDERADGLAQGAGGVEQGRGAEDRLRLDRPAGLCEPFEDVLVALKGVDE